MPFAFSLGSSSICGLAPDFELTASYPNAQTSPQTFSFRVLTTGEPGTVPTPFPTQARSSRSPMVTPRASTFPSPSAASPGPSPGSFSASTAPPARRHGGDDRGARPLVGRRRRDSADLAGGHARDPRESAGQVKSNSGDNFCQTVLEDGAAELDPGDHAGGRPVHTGTLRAGKPARYVLRRERQRHLGAERL